MARPTAFLLMALFLLGRVLFLELAGIEKHDGEEVGRRRRHQNLVPEALPDELREEPGVVEMDVGEEDEIERPRRNGKGGPVPFKISPLLIEAAVDEQPEAGRFDEIAGSGDLLASAEELDFQALSLPDRLQEGPV
jgi:hypothetical protein